MKPEQSRIEPSAADAEALVIRTMLRICVAVKGLDPALDPHIDRIRSTLKAGVDADQGERLSRLTDDLMRAADERASPGLLNRLLDHAALGAERRERALGLWSELVAKPDRITDRRLDELAAALGLGGERDTVATTPEPTDPTDASEPGQNPDTLLDHLLADIDWPQPIADDVAQLRARLATPGAWIEVIEALGRLVVDAVRDARRDAAGAGEFLLQLDQQLQLIDGYLNDEAKRRQASATAAGQFDRQLRTDFGRLQVDIADEADLARIRSRVVDGLGRIRESLDGFMTREAAQRDTAAEREAGLRRTLAALTDEAAELRRQLADRSEEARLDPLTDLPNRRAYDERIAEEFARFNRYREPLAVMLMDIDDFKQVNDRHGHQAGDLVLQQVAEVLNKGRRSSDFLARYGGEEFVVLLLGVDPAAAYLVAEKLRRAVERRVSVGGAPVTLSGGLTLFTDDDDIESALSRADQALYQAKAHGKNRCLLI